MGRRFNRLMAAVYTRVPGINEMYVKLSGKKWQDRVEQPQLALPSQLSSVRVGLLTSAAAPSALADDAVQVTDSGNGQKLKWLPYRPTLRQTDQVRPHLSRYRYNPKAPVRRKRQHLSIWG